MRLAPAATAAQRARDLFRCSQDRMSVDGTPDVAIIIAQKPRNPDPSRRELGNGPQIEIGQSAKTNDQHSFAVGYFPRRGFQ